MRGRANENERGPPHILIKRPGLIDFCYDMEGDEGKEEEEDDDDMFFN